MTVRTLDRWFAAERNSLLAELSAKAIVVHQFGNANQ
ncbi:MAG: hypothetical protein N838_02360 [Thiohalocapsa sp. PB-PSB1]|jgi:hypothetical protein|nr:MAG: hypothetical protein N838_02360 [Thiohalocapsa sp. PB-PSB1]